MVNWSTAKTMKIEPLKNFLLYGRIPKCYFVNFTATSEGVNIEELVDDFVTFYVAGQETTSSLLSFALIFTLQNPHVLERCSYSYMCIVDCSSHGMYSWANT